MSPARPPGPPDVRRLLTWFLLLVVLPVVGLVGFGVMAIANERAAVEKRFSEEYAGRFRALAEHLAVTLDSEAQLLSAPFPVAHSDVVLFDFQLDSSGLHASRPLSPESSGALEPAIRGAGVTNGNVALVSVPSGPARGVYAVRRDGELLRGIAFSERGLAAEVTAEGRARFPNEAARFTLTGPKDDPTPASNPMRRLVDEITSDHGESGVLSFPLPPPLAEWRITAQLPSGDPIRTALLRNRTIYIVVLSLFYVIIAVGVAVTLRGIWREVRLSQLKTDFVSNISHELRTPLTSIRMFAETLKLGRAQSREEQEACVDFIMKESERLSQIAERTLDWARIEAGRRAFDRRPHAPEKLVRESLETFFASVGLPRECVQVAIAPDLPEVDVDESAIGQVLLNLLENAVKYTGQDKRLHVRVRKAGRKVLFQVEDNGIGIAKREQKRIFERFYRSDDRLARGSEGSGLGLSIARRIVETHGGRIFVTSRPGHGSTFTFELPALRHAPAARLAPESPA